MKLTPKTMRRILLAVFLIAALAVVITTEYHLVALPEAEYTGEELMAALDKEIDAVNAILAPYDLQFPAFGPYDTEGIYDAEAESVLRIDESTEMVLELQCRTYRNGRYTVPEYILRLRRTADAEREDTSLTENYPYYYEIAAHLSGTLSAERFETYIKGVYEDVYANLGQTGSSEYDVFGSAEKSLPSLFKRSGYVSFDIQRATEEGELTYFESLGYIHDSVPIDCYEKVLYVHDYWRSNG